MNLSIHFNWPPPDLARVHFGTPNEKDANFEFRLGVMSDRNNVCWLNPGWFLGNINKEIVFDVKKSDIVIVERRRVGSEEVESRNMWNVGEEWPAEASGSAITIIPWYF